MVKPLLSRNFCEKRVCERVFVQFSHSEFHDAHNALVAHIFLWKFRESNIFTKEIAMETL